MKPTLLALDFDGVLCDGLPEYFETSWRVYRQMWSPASPIPAPDLFTRFARLRPVIETGWEMPVLLRALLLGFPEADLLENWPILVRQITDSERMVPEELATALDQTRDQWITRDRPDWLGHHQFYPGVIAQLRSWLNRSLSLVIITTKEGRFVQELLQEQQITIPEPQIYGKELGIAKRQVLIHLLRGMAQSNGRQPQLWFVEDRLKTLFKIAAEEELSSLRLYLAEWGYTTAKDRQEAQDSKRIQLLTLADFTSDFSCWPEPRVPYEQSAI
ncbi:MAG: HAD family hydrolase [Synechococcaceae cyanobacterium SM2_3_1]|nr:HAD family hydrolase [Synechococcaceae cyanobacterium SM2_3_1]